MRFGKPVLLIRIQWLHTVGGGYDLLIHFSTFNSLITLHELFTLDLQQVQNLSPSLSLFQEYQVGYSNIPCSDCINKL
jgi:hypothetical protein